MLCENCHKNEATLHYSQTVNGHKTEQNLCEECASAAGATFGHNSSFMNPDLTLGNLLSTVLGFPNNYAKTNPYTRRDVKCENCGMTFSEFLQQGKFGCSKCIESFGADIDESLKRIHGSDTHRGKKPVNYRDESYRTSDINAGNYDYKNTNIKTIDNVNINNSHMEVEETRDIDKLQEMLNQALKAEQYEECARLRDKIRGLEQEAKEGEEDS